MGTATAAEHQQPRSGVKWGDVKTKVVTWVLIGILGATATTVGWLWANVVLASDLEDALTAQAEMIGIEVAAAIKPLADAVEETNALARANAEDLRKTRLEATRAQIRGLQIDIEQMEQRKQAGDQWTQSDETLLGIWQEDLGAAQAVLCDLTGPPCDF